MLCLFSRRRTRRIHSELTCTLEVDEDEEEEGSIPIANSPNDDDDTVIEEEMNEEHLCYNADDETSVSSTQTSDIRRSIERAPSTTEELWDNEFITRFT